MTASHVQHRHEPNTRQARFQKTRCVQAPEDVDIAVSARVGGEDVVIWDDDHTLRIPHLSACDSGIGLCSSR